MADTTISKDDSSLPASVIKDCTSVQALLANAVSNDNPRSAIRATYKNLHDGGLPFDPVELAKEGQAARANFPSKQAKAITAENVNSYTDLRVNVVQRATIQIEVDGASAWENQEWSETISRGYSKLLSWWPEEFSMYQKSDFNRVYFGAGPVYFTNSDTWQPKASRYGEILTPKNAPTNLDELPWCFIRKNYYPADLYSFISNEKVATSVGWNVGAVKKALEVSYQRRGSDLQQWTPEDWQRQLKNDQYLSNDQTAIIPTAWFHYKELNGGIKWKMVCEWGDVKEFLFESKTTYPHFRDYLNPFFLETADGDWHSPMGLGSQFFAILKAMDLTNCQIADMVNIACSVMIIPESQSDATALQSVNLGPITVLPPNVKTQTVAFPNLMQGPLAYFRSLQQILQNTTGAFQPGQVDPSGSNPTATQIQAQIANAARLSGNQQVQFKIQEDQRHFQQLKRALNPRIRDDKEYGILARKFQDWCKKHGVPARALNPKWIVSVSTNLAAGSGSNAARMMMADMKLQTLGAIQDPTARLKCTKEAFSEKYGPDYADRAFPEVPPVQTEQQQAEVAQENALFELGKELPVFGWQNAEIHLQGHLPHAAMAYQASQSGQLPLMQAYQQLSIELPHIQQHLAQIVFNPFLKEVAEQYNDAFQELVRLFQRLQQQLGDQIEAQQKAQMEQQQAMAEMLQKAQQSMSEGEIEKLKLQWNKQQLSWRKQGHKELMDKDKLALQVGKQRQDMAVTDIDTALAVKESNKPEPVSAGQ